MRGRHQANKKAFEAVCKSGEIVLTCYCSFEKQGRKCHRRISADILRKVAEKESIIEVKICGEAIRAFTDVKKVSDAHPGGSPNFAEAEGPVLR